MLDSVVISDDDVCCSVVFSTLVGVLVLSVMGSELLMTSAITVECAFTSLVNTEWGMSDMYCMQCCMSVSVVL